MPIRPAIITAGARSDVRAPAPSPQPANASPRVLVPKFKTMVLRWDEYFWQEMREGGKLHAYLQRERARSKDRIRAVSRKLSKTIQNNKSDFKLLAAVPAREFFRWRQEDEHFWDDNKNLKSLKRDNPDMHITV